MELSDKIKAIYPDLTNHDFMSGVIVIQSDLDEKGAYIREWNHPTHPLPTQEQLDAVGSGQN